jgi:hypothetical protein
VFFQPHTLIWFFKVCAKKHYFNKENVEMSVKKMFVLAGVLIVTMFVLAACAGPAGPAGPQGPAGAAGATGPQGPAGEAPKAADLSCTACHNDTSVLEGKIYTWEESKHGTAGLAWAEEAGNQACAGCHEGSSFVQRIVAGQDFAAYAAAKDITLPDATPQTCRTCHTIHTTYTTDDFALRTVAPVAMVISKQTFDKGMGNLCVNCHQARRYMANFASKDAAGAAIAGKIDVSTRFNPHLSNQADMMLGVGGGGTVTGSPSAHYTMTTDSCVTCHLGGTANHTFKAQVSACVACHADATSTDVNGAVTAIQVKFDALKAALIAAKQLDDAGSPIAVKGVDEAVAFPLWVYGYIMEDGSMGVHNPKYANALLDAALTALGK